MSQQDTETIAQRVACRRVEQELRALRPQYFSAPNPFLSCRRHLREAFIGAGVGNHAWLPWTAARHLDACPYARVVCVEVDELGRVLVHYVHTYEEGMRFLLPYRCPADESKSKD